MGSSRVGALLLVLAWCAPALAQAPAPQDPYAGAPQQDPVLAEQIAAQLVARAQELLDAKIYVDAKQLAVEALVESPKGAAAEHARAIIKQVNQQLGIVEEEPAPEPKPTPHPVAEPAKKPAEPAVVETGHPGKAAAYVHGAFYGGVVGAAVGSLFDTRHPAKGAIPVGIGLAIAGGLGAPRLAEHWHADEAQVRTIGSGSLWGAVIGAFFADVVTGANGGHATGSSVLVGGGIGATVGLGGGIYMAKEQPMTRGDVALVDTLAGIGTVGGLTIGMLMQPAQPEAYSLNAVLGAAGGVIAGIIAAPDTNTTPGRMVRVAGLAALGGGLPLTILAAGPHSSGVQRAAGALSTIGLVGGAWLGFYLTRDFEAGKDVPDTLKPGDAPPAVIGRDSDGRWHLGGLALQPLSPQLSTQSGMSMTVLGGTF